MKIKFLIFLFIGFGLLSCKKNKPDDKDLFVDNFNRSALLNNMGTNLIIENYRVLKNGIDSLELFAVQFNSVTDQTNLTLLRNQYFEVYNRWLSCSVYEFGPAMTVGLRLGLNTFPCDTTKINSNIASGTWDLSTAANSDAIGLNAIDFLLFGSVSNDNLLLNYFTLDVNASNRKNYLNAVIDDIQSRVDYAYNGWLPSGGNYINTFVNSTSTSAGSSLSFLVNQLNYDYEILKNARIGIPLGKRTLNIPLPEKCEALYSAQSINLAIEHVNGIENVFRGRSRYGVDGVGLDDYLDYLSAESNGTALSVAINNKFNEIRTALASINGPLSDAVINDATTVNIAYTKILEGLILLKTEMPSALSILITYADNDGD